VSDASSSIGHKTDDSFWPSKPDPKAVFAETFPSPVSRIDWTLFCDVEDLVKRNILRRVTTKP
jgi:hypothetical protein